MTDEKHKMLYLSRKNKKILGVLGGLGEYFDIDPTVFRLVFVLLTFMTGIVPLSVGYFAAALIIPKEPN
jgi:phage shock protein C